MRLLVLDGSRVLRSVVGRLAPPGVELEVAESLEEAMKVLRRDPPHAVIANLTPVGLPWEELKTFCQRQSPPIPVLFESCVHQSAEEAGLSPLNHSAFFLAKPYGIEELRRHLALLVTAAADRLRPRSASPPAAANPYRPSTGGPARHLKHH